MQDLNEFIREISEIYDKDSNDTFVSLYINRGSDKKIIDKRIQTCKSILKGHELDNFSKTMDEIDNFLRSSNIKHPIAIFASHKYNFINSIQLSVPIDSSLVVDSSPYIRPLARIQDEWESFTLVLISTNYAKLFSVSLGKVEHTKKLSKDIMNKHKKGGCSQARFNRLRRGAIHAFFVEVKEALEKIADERIILAGPGNAKQQFRELLPKNLQDNIIETIGIDIDDEKELLKESKYLISEKEKQKGHDAVIKLKQEILKDGLAVYGVQETLNAVKNGQVDLLLIQKDIKLHGWICEHCQVANKGTASKCPYCNGEVSEVDVLEEILEFAKRTDAEIEFTSDEELSNLGHVGAILRFK